MALNIGITELASNLGVGFEWIVLIIVLFGSIIFFAKDFRIGLIMLFVGSGMCFALFYQLNLNYVPAIVISFMSLVVLSFSLYAVSKTTVDTGGLI